jgi:hypothetical protein
MKQRLEQAGRTYREAPAELRAVILASGRAGDKPAEIHKTIGYVYTYDYVARLVREDRAKNPGLHAY